MRINFTLPVLVLSMAVFCLSCSKKDAQADMSIRSAPQAIQELNAVVTPDGLFELNVNSDGVKIHKQASHFAVSSIGTSKNGKLQYKYTPAKGFTGSDEVTLSELKTSVTAGGGCNYDGKMESRNYTTTTFTKIKFTVK